MTSRAIWPGLCGCFSATCWSGPFLPAWRLQLRSPPVVQTAIAAFIWAAIPSALAAIVVLPRVLSIGRFGWIDAAAGGVIGFAVVAVLTGTPGRELLPGLAFVAGLVSICVQRAMEAGGIIRAQG